MKRGLNLLRLIRKFSSLKSARPQTPPLSGLCKLTVSRRLILVHGIDSIKYLQGVTTANISPLSGNKGVYSAFLNAKGRVLFDVFIYPTNTSATWKSSVANPNEPGFLIECDKNSVSGLMLHIKRYKLRSKFTVREVEPGEWDVWSTWGATNEQSRNMGSDNIWAQDIRAPCFGNRLVIAKNARPISENIEVDEATYKLRRILYGIPEGQGEILEGQAMPQESCIDFMGGIDFHKGCYVGQELTIRTHHTGVVRKRILPVQIYQSDLTIKSESLQYNNLLELELPPIGSDIMRMRNRRKTVGKFLTGIGNVGLALCRLEKMTSLKLTEGTESQYSADDEFSIDWEEKSVKVKAFMPGWHLIGHKTTQSSPLKTTT